MKPLNRLQNATFLLGGLLMVVGAGCFVLMWQQPVACWVFLVGAILFGSMQMVQTYEGCSQTIRRLKRIMTLADLFFIFAGILMVDHVHGFLLSAFSNYLDYYQYVYNKWVALLLVAAFMEVYTIHRIGSELERDDK